MSTNYKILHLSIFLIRYVTSDGASFISSSSIPFSSLQLAVFRVIIFLFFFSRFTRTAREIRKVSHDYTSACRETSDLKSDLQGVTLLIVRLGNFLAIASAAIVTGNKQLAISGREHQQRQRATSGQLTSQEENKGSSFKSLLRPPVYRV